jgi:hypothetical protein
MISRGICRVWTRGCGRLCRVGRPAKRRMSVEEDSQDNFVSLGLGVTCGNKRRAAKTLPDDGNSSYEAQYAVVRLPAALAMRRAVT